MSSISSTQLAGVANLALLAPVKPDFVEGCEAFTYAKRLDSLLKTFNAIRLASRESSIVESPFPDPVFRADILHSFRYAIVPPEIGKRGELPVVSDTPRPGVYRLSLNVTFDGGWEPYIRVIHRDLGPLLDAIFCNCVGYPRARSHSFDEYARWVHAHEIPGGLFYAESSMTVLDQRYLAAVEKVYRQAPSAPMGAQLERAKLHISRPPATEEVLGKVMAALGNPQLLANLVEAVTLHLKALKGMHDLEPLYPDNTDHDDQTLLRFAQSAFREFRLLLRMVRGAPGDPRFEKFARLLAPFEDPIAWLVSDEITVEAFPPRAMAYGPDSKVQGGIVQRYENITHGCLALLRVSNATKARDCLASLADTQLSIEGEPRQDGIQCNVALSASGLRALGLPAWRLQRFPPEFIEGMEARAGMLGDLRGNHPDRWRRPLLAGDAEKRRIDLASLHVLVQYRIAAGGAAPVDDVHPQLQQKVDELASVDNGLQLLAMEPMLSWPDAQGAISRESFGFRDGLSQPEIDDAVPQSHTSRPWDNKVPRGEIFLGHANERGDGPHPTDEDRLLDEGSFLALRKIRQHVERLEEVLQRAAETVAPRQEQETGQDWQGRLKPIVEGLKTKMMGRSPDGAPATNPALSAADNSFTYANDQAGIGCPFHAHARRANPRIQLPTPRIMRRGMSYDAHDGNERNRGVFFMAYCASLSEQFEVIQRWISGGNSTGVLSGHSDPMLGVPRAGEPRLFEYFDGPPGGETLRCISLGDQPFTELQWGMYLFVPSVNALRELTPIVGELEPAQPRSFLKSSPLAAWRRAIEDPVERRATWKKVSESKAGTDTPYGLLLAHRDLVLQALQDDGQKAHSVCGYGRRFNDTVGDGYLGFDGQAHAQEAETGVNSAIEKISVQQAFDLTRKKARELFAPFGVFPTRVSGAKEVELLLDLSIFSELVLARLCTEWFGLPDAQQNLMTDRTRSKPDNASCPASFLSISRYVFWPHPSSKERRKAIDDGHLIQDAVKGMLQLGTPLVGLSEEIRKTLTDTGQVDAIARTIAGVMLGFPPTVHINFLRIMRGWIEQRGGAGDNDDGSGGASLWDLQSALIAEQAGGQAGASEMLKAELLEQMRQHPAPEVIWREKPGSKLGPKNEEPDKIVLSLAGVMQTDAGADESIMFGGTREKGYGHGVHACPGYKMAVGVMLGMATEVLLAGTLRPTPSSTILKLVLKA